MSRKRPRNRPPFANIIYIGTEGSKTEPRYFNSLKQKLGHRATYVNKRKKKTHTDATEVIKYLIDLKETAENEHSSDLSVEFWAVVDRNGKPSDQFQQIVSKASGHGISLADSNPCFELWLLLHHAQLDKLKGLSGAAETKGCGAVVAKLKEFDPSYSKARFKADVYIDLIHEAMAHAENSERILATSPVGTNVHKLVSSMM